MLARPGALAGQTLPNRPQPFLPPPSNTRPFQCADCGCVFRAAGGSAVKCPGCAAVIDVPAAAPGAVAEPSKLTSEAVRPQSSLLGGGLIGGPGRAQTDTQSMSQGINTAQTYRKEQSLALANSVKNQMRAKPGQPGAPNQAGMEKVQGHPWVTALRSVAEWQWAIPAPGACDEHLVILMIGASNMVGRAIDCPAVIRKPLSGPAWHCDSAGRMAKGCGEPMHPMDGKGTGIGMGRSFARRLLRNLPRHGVFLCPSAVGHGDMTMNAWHRDGVLYSIAVARARTCAQAVRGRVAGVIWHSGEHDACTKEDAVMYGERLTELIDNLRTDLDNPELPVVVGEIGESYLCAESALPEAYKYAREVNQALRKIGKLPWTECVPAPATCIADKLHFDTAAMEELGGRYAEQWEKMWANLIRNEQRMGPDGKPHTKVSWLRQFGSLVVGDQHNWATAARFNPPPPRLAIEGRKDDGGDRHRRRRRDGEGEEGRRRRRDEGDDGGRRRRRREEDGEGKRRRRDDDGDEPDHAGSAAGAEQAGAGAKPQGAGRAAGDERVQRQCPHDGCGAPLQAVPQYLLDAHRQDTGACDSEGCENTMLVLRAALCGWRCCLKCDRGFCSDCTSKCAPLPASPKKRERSTSPDARMPGE
eukprot:TRINITY_DN2105_c0_g1_i1.p1 TRINITY_DN2105_c0_g1~~TRINITY_DN2105_c0_g1_i1.p1  ORF type:complete len:679 (+),score=158.76 TRINITY_DN2105_c0_g1_i1:109-2037(+)